MSLSTPTPRRRRGLRWPLWLSRSARPKATPSDTTLSVAAAPDQPAESGAELMRGVWIFHDGSDRPPSVGPTGDRRIQVRTAEFDGSYVSFVANLPPEMASEIRVGVNLLVRLDTEADPAVPVFVRAHFRNEEGREVLHDLIVLERGQRELRFNLDGLRIPLELATTAWVDAVCSNPDGVTLGLSSMTLEIEEQ